MREWGWRDNSLAASRFEDAPDKAPTAQETAELRRHFVDLVDRLSRVHFAVNYADAMGTEFLENSIVRVFLDAELLHQQRHPTYIRPLSVADQHALRRWLQAQLGTISAHSAWMDLKHSHIRTRTHKHTRPQQQRRSRAGHGCGIGSTAPHAASARSSTCTTSPASPTTRPPDASWAPYEPGQGPPCV